MQITVILVQIQTGRLRVVKATAREGGGFPLATTAPRDQLNAKAITIKAVLPPLGVPTQRIHMAGISGPSFWPLASTCDLVSMHIVHPASIGARFPERSGVKPTLVLRPCQ